MTSSTRGSRGQGRESSGKSGKGCRGYYIPVCLALAMLAVLCGSYVQSAKAAPKSHANAVPDQDSFLSATALGSSQPGTPVKPSKKVILCHNGHTIRVSWQAVDAHIGHGDYLGPCSNQVVICHRYANYDNPEHLHEPYRTIIVNQKDVSSYLALGDTLGACPNQVFMCNKKNKTIVVSSGNVNEHLALGQTMGLCPGKTLMCHKGKTIVVDDSDVQEHLNDGDCLGYCYGSAGPLIGQTTPCSSNPPSSFVTSN